MITWMTRASILDTAADLETGLLAQSADEAMDLLGLLVYGYAPEGSSLEEAGTQDPAYRMWVGYEPALAAYVAGFSAELQRRGLAHGQHLAARNLINELRAGGDTAEFVRPPWFDDTDVLQSHRSNLVRRWPDEYASRWPGTPADWPYLWPFTDDDWYKLFVSGADKDLLRTKERSLPKDIQEKVENLP